MPVIYKGGGIVYNSTAKGATPPVVTQTALMLFQSGFLFLGVGRGVGFITFS